MIRRVHARITRHKLGRSLVIVGITIFIAGQAAVIVVATKALVAKLCATCCVSM